MDREETEKDIKKFTTVLQKLIEKYNFYFKSKDFDDYRSKLIYFIGLELEDKGVNHTDYIIEKYNPKAYYKNDKIYYKDFYSLFIKWKEVDNRFLVAFESVKNKLTKRLNKLSKDKHK
jgi:hypothetical protein